MIDNFEEVPNQPGVYQFYDTQKIIYIGKAKNLNKRVRSYFTKSIKDRKTDQIKRLAIRVETFVTHSEEEALILEQQLIKKHKPRFNILLRDDKTYPYIYFSEDHDYPSISLRRNKNAVNANFFGPYSSAKFARNLLKELQKIFRLRNCSNTTFANRSRPCIEYQMKRCSAPCTNYISKIDYKEDIICAKDYLVAEKKQLLSLLSSKMQEHVKTLEFEEADSYKQRISSILNLQAESGISNFGISLDIIHASFKENKTGISIIVIRDGKIQNTKTYFLTENREASIDDLFQNLAFTYYQSINQVPTKILMLNKLQKKELLLNALTKKFSKKVNIVFYPPKNSHHFVKLAKLNSHQAIINNISRKARFREEFEELRQLFNIQQESLSLECIDISHHNGSHPSASVIHLTEEGFQKINYRHYKIPNNLAGNDPGSIGFAVSKRFNSINKAPSLLLIDGGISQLNAALACQDNDHTIVLSIKKGINRKAFTETIYSKHGQQNFLKDSKLYRMLLLARDEAHRFAIKLNRNSRKKYSLSSILDSVTGIGPIKKKRLLKKYKNISLIKRQSIQELTSVKGISVSVAKEIKALLNQSDP